MSYLRENASVLLVVAIVFEAVIAILWRRQIINLKARLASAVEAAEDAARAAALAAPGAIDPEAVLLMIRAGQTPTLDSVSDLMRRQEATSAAAGGGDRAPTAGRQT